MHELKKLAKEAIPKALDRAMRYRFLAEPFNAESICRDVIAVDPENQDAYKILILALTDQFDHDFRPAVRVVDIKEELVHIKSEYYQAYYTGLIYERRGLATLKGAVPGAEDVAYDLLAKAIESYETAFAIHPEKNEDSLVRYNSCVRAIKRYDLKEALPETFVPYHD